MGSVSAPNKRSLSLRLGEMDQSDWQKEYLGEPFDSWLVAGPPCIRCEYPETVPEVRYDSRGGYRVNVCRRCGKVHATGIPMDYS